MRHVRVFLVASALLAPASVHASPVADAAARQLVAQLATPGDRAATPAVLAQLAPRLAALGLSVRRTLDEGLAPAPQAMSAHAVARTPFDFDPSRIVLLEAPDASAAALARAALETDPAIDWIEPNLVRALALESLASRFTGFPNDSLLRAGVQWGLYNPGPSGFFGGIPRADVHALEAWPASVGSNDVKLAVADTGIDPAQPELGGLMPDGRPRITDAINVTLEPLPAVTDSFGHGTPVAGVMAARTNDGQHFSGLGVAGVCGGDGVANAGCRIVPIKIAAGHSGEASTFDIARAMVHATNVGARAMNLSFAGTGASRIERNALQYALTHGCVVVCAAGNQGFTTPTLAMYPAAYAQEDLCIQVGASDSFDQRTSFSSYGPGLDFVAPGINIETTFMTYPSYYGAVYDGYVAASGTSFAAPFATGAVGLLAAARPELMDTDFQRILRESCDDIGAPGVDLPTAHGRLNLARALDAVRAELGIWHDEAPADNFTGGIFDTLTIGEGGIGNLDRHRGRPWAERIEALARVALPDSFLDSVRVWPRIGGTLSLRGDFRIAYWTPSSSVLQLDERSFILHGYLYRVLAPSCPDCLEDQWVPLPPDQIRFGFTVIGRVDRKPTVTILGTPPSVASPGDTIDVAWSATDPDSITRFEIAFVNAAGVTTTLAAPAVGATSARVLTPCTGASDTPGTLRVTAYDEHGRQHDAGFDERPLTVRGSGCPPPGGFAAFAIAPNPMRGGARIETPGAGTVHVLDAGGRILRTLHADGSAITWDGRDGGGRALKPGLYFARFAGSGLTRTLKLVRLGQ